MLHDARITIRQHTLEVEEARSYLDFTPEDRLQFARELTVEVPGLEKTHVELSEINRDDPNVVYVGLYPGLPPNGTIGELARMEGVLTVSQLDIAIELLTLARDVAICEGMIAPA